MGGSLGWPMTSVSMCLLSCGRCRPFWRTNAGSTSIGVTLEELVDGGRGVCQDFAHLAVGMLRCVGIPARYVWAICSRLDETQLPETDPDGASDGAICILETAPAMEQFRHRLA